MLLLFVLVCEKQEYAEVYNEKKRRKSGMNEVIRQLLERKSVRVFTDKEIKEHIVEEILLSAVSAPTAGNQQLYTILRITDQNILE